MHQISSSDALAAQMEIMNKIMSQMLSSIKSVGSVATSVVSQPAPAPVCSICGVPGHGGECIGISVAESSAQSIQEVNYAPSQGPYSHNYNPQWRQHPNLSYKNNMPAQSSFFSSVSHPAQQQPQSQTAIEKLMEKQMEMMANMSKTQMEMMSNVSKTQMEMLNAVQKLANKMEDIFVNNGKGIAEARLPAQAKSNPRNMCGAITTRSGRTTEPLLPTPSIPRNYVPPQLRTEKNSKNAAEEVVQKKSQASTSENLIDEAIQKSKQKLPFPEKNDKSKEDKHYAKFIEMMKEVQITIPILEAVLHVPMYAKFFKELLTKKRSIDEPGIVTLTKECSAMILNQMPQKLEDPGSFGIPCVVGNRKFSALCDLGSSVSVVPLSVCQSMKLGELESTPLTLQLADRTLRKPAGVLLDVPIIVNQFAYPVDFIVLGMEDKTEAVILGRPFLATAGALIDVQKGKLTLKFGEDELIFDMKHPTNLPHCLEECLSVDIIDECVAEGYKVELNQPVEAKLDEKWLKLQEVQKKNQEVQKTEYVSAVMI
ncbi:uncharacterized protein LOC112270692 [Brachypodium distachyon]|uniref:uncharacterized protein LOC112270692 n=1 Tax=Brachypodium distachyon TaxID=15368 RepID=UPI00052FFF35|nr:uncharacterized protein LOC112270692 [Brachypodium distachyon]|eukprot:XP_024314490.1 uncharacterized protein LOC112270692 [Brachypodium distachyon]